MELSQKQKMLGTALFLKRVDQNFALSIMMALETDDEIDDMTWYMGEHPEASQEELLAVAYQLAKDARG